MDVSTAGPKRSHQVVELDKICRNHTGFSSFEDLLHTEGYRPSIDMRAPWGPRLANAYDYRMWLRDDNRRAYRYGMDKTAPSETTSVLVVKNAQGVTYEECIVACDDDGDFRLCVLAALRHMVLRAGDTITLEPV